MLTRNRDTCAFARRISIATIIAFLALSAWSAQAQCGARTDDEIAETIARGHAYRKHVEGRDNGETGREFDAGRVIARLAFPPPTIGSPDDFGRHVQRVLGSGFNQAIERDRHKYWDPRSGTIVIVDRKSRDCGTAFRPSGGRRYYDNLK
jgi:hypothetical protein